MNRMTHLKPVKPVKPVYPRFVCVDVAADDAIEMFMDAHRDAIRPMIGRLADDDPYMMSAVHGAALIALWKADASRFSDAEAPELLALVESAMRRARRRELRAMLV